MGERCLSLLDQTNEPAHNLVMRATFKNKLIDFLFKNN